MYIVPTTRDPNHIKDLIYLRKQAGYGEALVDTTWQKAIDDGLRIQYLFYLGEGNGVHVVKEAPPNAELLAMIAADIEDLYASKYPEVASREKGIVYGASCVVENRFRGQGWANALTKWLQDEVIRLGAKQVDRGQPAWKTGWNVKIFSSAVRSENEAGASILRTKGYEEIKRVANYYENHELHPTIGDHVVIFFKKQVTDEERLKDEVIRLGAKHVDRGQPAWKIGWNVKYFTSSVVSTHKASISLLHKLCYDKGKTVHNYYKNHPLEMRLAAPSVVFYKKKITDKQRLR
ncbi:hypothetical protein BZG36_04540, partial [Bifiguratus adelaidae]